MPPTIPDDVLAKHEVLVDSDNAFQRRARLLQALWREARGLKIGSNRGRPLGSRIEAGQARETLANFLTDAIREEVRRAVGPGRTSGQLFDEDRLFTNLLSSQPLCFNAFGELVRDLDLATTVVRRLLPERVDRVIRAEFEFSPGRGDVRFTGDKSAFDVFLAYRSASGRRGFLGVEVKYHENLDDDADPHRPRYDEVADKMDCFKVERGALQRRPLQQIWRDHLLAGSLIQDGADFDEGMFVFLCPAENEACLRALTQYRAHLKNESSFQVWTLEAFVDALAASTPASWVAELRDRYLAFEKLAACVSAAGGRS